MTALCVAIKRIAWAATATPPSGATVGTSGPHLREAFDPRRRAQRFQPIGVRACEVFADFSKKPHGTGPKPSNLLVQALAKAVRCWPPWRDAHVCG